MNYNNKQLYILKKGWSWKNKPTIDNRFEFLYGPIYVPDVVYHLKQQAGINDPVALVWGEVITAKNPSLSMQDINPTLKYIENADFSIKKGIIKSYLSFEVITKRTTKLFCQSLLFKKDDFGDLIFQDNIIIRGIRLKPKHYFSEELKDSNLLYDIKRDNLLIGGRTKQEMHDYLLSQFVLKAIKLRVDRANDDCEYDKIMAEKLNEWGYKEKIVPQVIYIENKTLYSLILYLGMIAKNGIR